MKSILDKLHNKEIEISKYIDNEIKSSALHNNIVYIIQNINTSVNDLIKELLDDITNKIDGILSNDIVYENILSNIQSITNKEEYIITYSVNLKSRLYKYILKSSI